MSNTKKYTDEQLSRILSEAAAGNLGGHGDYIAGRKTACINQAALATWAVVSTEAPKGWA